MSTTAEADDTAATPEYLDPTAARIVLAARRGDSINRIADRIGVSYSWVYDWVDRLQSADVIARTDSGVEVVDHELRAAYGALLAALYRRSGVGRDDAYEIPHFARLPFAFTELDAAYVWTDGGFQAARPPDDYPVFVRIADRDVGRWQAFFARFGVDVTVGDRPDADAVEGPVHYVLFPQSGDPAADWHDGHPVIPLSETVALLSETPHVYDPALEIIDETYDVDVPGDQTHHRARGE